jgi:CBS domain-containing protein
MHVSDLMTTGAASCSAAEPMSCAARRMWERDIGWLPVVDDRGGLVGAITDRDICMAAYTQGRPLAELRVEVAMARDVARCTPREELVAIERRMAARQLRRLPVVDDDGVLIGVITLADLARASLARGAVAAGAVAAVLAAIGEPHHRDDPTTAVAA